MDEAEAHLENTLASWRQAIPPEEAKRLERLPEKQIAAFRICRELASLEDKSAPRFSFYLSFGDLAARLATSPAQSMRIMAQLEGIGCLEVSRKGKPKRKGHRGTATTYGWNWSLPDARPKPTKATIHSTDAT